jgi:hypothetical protein
MPITREENFLISRDISHVPSLGIESAMLRECIEEIHTQRFKAVFGSPSFGFEETTLDFLNQMKDLESVWFWEVNLKNIDALYSLSSLLHFGVHDKRPAIDFSRLPSLQNMTWIHKEKDSGVSRLKNLKFLQVWHYRPKSKSFADLLLPDELLELQLNWANPATLEGLKPIASLRRLEIHRCRNLKNLAQIPQLFPRLEHLVVAACGQISSAESSCVVAQLPGLKHAYVQGRKLV